MVPQHIAVWAAVDYILALSSAFYDLVDACLKPRVQDEAEFCTGCKKVYRMTTSSIGKVDARAQALVAAPSEEVYQTRLEALMRGWCVLRLQRADDSGSFRLAYCSKLAYEDPQLERAWCNPAHSDLHSLWLDLKRAYVGLEVATLYFEVDGEHLPSNPQYKPEGSSAYADDDQSDLTISDILSLTASLKALTLASRDLSVMTKEQRRSFLSALLDVDDVLSTLSLTRTCATGTQ